jgi:hypothetical protein
MTTTNTTLPPRARTHANTLTTKPTPIHP